MYCIVSPSWRLFYLERRDHGVCASCHLDTTKVERVFRRLQNIAHDRKYGEIESERHFLRRTMAKTRLCCLVAKLNESGWCGCFGPGSSGVPNIRKALWEADHITPKILGCTDDLDNFQTLCVPCHKAATKRLARYRASRRRKRLDLYAPDTFA